MEPSEEMRRATEMIEKADENQLWFALDELDDEAEDDAWGYLPRDPDPTP